MTPASGVASLSSVHNRRTNDTVNSTTSNSDSDASLWGKHLYPMAGILGGGVILGVVIAIGIGLYLFKRRAKKKALTTSVAKDPLPLRISSDKDSLRARKPELDAVDMERNEIEGRTYHGPKTDGFVHVRGELAGNKVFEMAAREGIGNEVPAREGIGNEMPVREGVGNEMDEPLPLREGFLAK